jgi:MOSC domain-containing protein YiiM
MGENLTTSGLDLARLPTGTLLHIGQNAVLLRVTGLRNPCRQIEDFQRGLLAAVAAKDAGGHITRKTGIMSVVLSGGIVRPGDCIRVEYPDPPHHPLEVV